MFKKGNHFREDRDLTQNRQLFLFSHSQSNHVQALHLTESIIILLKNT